MPARVFRRRRKCDADSEAVKLAAREIHPDGSRIKVGNVEIGGKRLVVMAVLRDRKPRQMEGAAAAVKQAGAHMLRGGAFKPAHPVLVPGDGRGGTAALERAGRDAGLPVVTEVMDPHDIERVGGAFRYASGRRSQCTEFLAPAPSGQSRQADPAQARMSSKLDEFLMAAEYILSAGNPNVVLCERGIRTFETATRNTLDLNAIPLLKQWTHLPIIVDPSHGTGTESLVIPMAMAAVAAGADGLMIEVHPEPEKALSDGPQQLRPAASPN